MDLSSSASYWLSPSNNHCARFQSLFNFHYCWDMLWWWLSAHCRLLSLTHPRGAGGHDGGGGEAGLPAAPGSYSRSENSASPSTWVPSSFCLRTGEMILTWAPGSSHIPADPYAELLPELLLKQKTNYVFPAFTSQTHQKLQSLIKR